ncbi:MBL fold metallo-hydrolase [Streptomyces peucetius]|uniref:MBL fold metallo-hydrolase n=1 Tax=Streptomyces peucetius TaxID=1950 RepID=A0ABY6I590_STRPE|nr:MBL fold metallo-hydrolase [Streptomyces peucetius]UYQ62142.1 MBL fold metallo-hydrolase [Streptomyces peucetius]
MPGHLPELPARAGIGAGDVDTVVLTHLHEDHNGWRVTADGAPVFPDADHLVQRRETDALGEEDTATTHVVRPLREAGLLRQIDGRRRIPYGRAGSLTLVPTPGHTPGHQSVLAESGTRDVVITGDVLVHAVQLADPAVAYHYEADPATAARSRRRLLEEAGERGALLATAHLRRAFVDAREGLPAPVGAGRRMRRGGDPSPDPRPARYRPAATR